MEDARSLEPLRRARGRRCLACRRHCGPAPVRACTLSAVRSDAHHGEPDHATPVVEKPQVLPKPLPVKPRVATPAPPVPQQIVTAAPTAPEPTLAPAPPPPAPVAAAPPPAPAPAVALPVVPPNFSASYLENPAPAYPPLSRRVGEQGKVMLRVLVNAKGTADTVELALEQRLEPSR